MTEGSAGQAVYATLFGEMSLNAEVVMSGISRVLQALGVMLIRPRTTSPISFCSSLNRNS
jgi:hypothetical protein